MRTALTAFTALVASFLLASAATTARAQERPSKPGKPEQIDRRFPLSPRGAVKVFNFVGSIRIIGWDRDSIAVIGTLQAGARFFGGGGPDGIKLGIEGSFGGQTAAADLVIHVPANAQVWARGAATDVSVEGVIGSLDVGSVGGRVRVAGAPRELLVESMDGAVEIIGSPGVLRAKTASGPLTWRGAGNEATLTSVSGRIAAEGGPLGRARIETITGDVSVLAALRTDASVSIESHSGSVELRIPRDVPVWITADVSQMSGPGIKPSAGVAAPKRAAPRELHLNGPAKSEATVTVRSFKGALRLLQPE